MVVERQLRATRHFISEFLRVSNEDERMTDEEKTLRPWE